MHEGIPVDLKNPLESASGSIAFGDESFVRQVRVLVQDPCWPDDADGFRELTISDNYPAAAVCRAVETLFADLSACQKARVLIYCLRRFTVLTGREIAGLTGRTPSAVSHAWRSIRERSRQELAFGERLALLERGLAIERSVALSVVGTGSLASTAAHVAGPGGNSSRPKT